MTNDANFLFDDRGRLRQSLFADDARETLKAISAWLSSQRRRMFLPLDLLIVLVDQGNEPLARIVAEGASGSVHHDELAPRLRALADEIEEETTDDSPTFERGFFSRGFTRILIEAATQAEARGESIRREDLARAMIWRAEAIESASVRWAIRRLGEGGGDRIFDEKGLLREPIFQGPMWDILQGAKQLAASHGTPFLGTPHLIARLCTVKNSTIWRSAKARGFEPSRLREELLRLIGTRTEPIPDFLLGRKTLTPRMVRMLSHSAARAGYKNITEADIVDGFLHDGGSSLELIQALGLEAEMRRALGEPKVLEEISPVEEAIQLNTRRRPTPTLDMLGRDLTSEALEGKLPEIVGREIELQRVVNVLLRREQRNPLLTGEAGVGKTALAIALAQKIASGRVPKKLQHHRVVEINGANLMSGTSYRGDLESRIKGLLEEASEDVILFIDEAHAVFAPRAGSHAPAEVPNHFKSALASGSIAVVAATTEAEFRRWIEQDPPLKRRFERIEVGEPSEDLVRHILGSLVEDLEQEYEVNIAPEAIDWTIDLSVRFMPEQRLPDKAKKLLMDACIARAHYLVEPTAPTPSADPDASAERSGPVDAAVVQADTGETNTTLVTREDVAQQVCLKTGVPMERLLRGEINWWVGIEDRLAEQVLGQDAAINDLARALISSRLRSAQKERPMAVLLFAGPMGVGKGTLASALAQEIFGSTSALIRLDMTDFQEAHSISRLIGSPPGYVGYEDEDLFVTPLRRRPSSVVVLEDFDRAHPHIQERMLRLMREGKIADTRGAEADVRNAMFILTLNIETAQRDERIGFGSTASNTERTPEQILSDWNKSFATRIKGYVDATIIFHELSGDNNSPVLALLERRIQHLLTSVKDEYSVALDLSRPLRKHLARLATQHSDARSVETLIEQHLYDPITDALLAGTCPNPANLHWDSAEQRVIVRAPLSTPS